MARSRSARHSEGRFLVEGSTLIDEAVSAGHELLEVFVDRTSTSRVDEAVLQRLSVAATEVGDGLLAKVGASVSPQPVLAVAPIWPTGLDSLPESLDRVLVLADVADPGNAGTLLRCAEASGVDAVVLAGDCVDSFSPKVVRASAGSLFRVPFAAHDDVPSALEHLRSRGLRLVGTDAAKGSSHFEADLGSGVALILGNESRGLTPEATAEIDDWVHIPIAGSAESLNVAMAGAVLCFEGLRQQSLGSPEPQADSLSNP